MGGQLFHAQELLEAVAEILVEDVEVVVAGQGLADGQVMGLVARQGDAALRQHGGGQDEKQLGADKNGQQPFFQAQGIEAEQEFARGPQPAGQEEQREQRGQQQQVPRAQAEIAAVPIEQAHGPEQQAGGEGEEAAAAAAERRPLRLQQGEQEQRAGQQPEAAAGAENEKSGEPGQGQQVGGGGRGFPPSRACFQISFSSTACARSMVFIASRPVSAMAS